MGLKRALWKFLATPAPAPPSPPVALASLPDARLTLREGQVPPIREVGPLVDPRRLAAVNAVRRRGRSAATRLQELVQATASELDLPICYATLLDDQHIIFLAHVGLSGDLDRLRMADRRETVCQYVVNSGSALAISDAHLDPLLCQVPSVVALGIRAYLGEPVVNVDGEVVGTFCMLDSRPRQWATRERTIARRTAQLISAILMEVHDEGHW